jgi:hypothetical protein
LVLLISYDLNGHERPSAYTSVKKTIEQHAISWARPLYSQWFVQTNDSVQMWSDRIQSVADQNDAWFVLEVRRPYQGWLSKEVWDWLNSRV